MSGDETTGVFAPMRGTEPVVVGVVGLRLQALGRSPSPGEWFMVTGVLAMLVALATAERLGRRLGRPLRRLVGAAHRLERGEPVAGLDTGGDEDVEALGRAFTKMAREVQRREEDLRREPRPARDRPRHALGGGGRRRRLGRIELSNPAARPLLGGARTIPSLAARFAPEIAEMATRAAGVSGSKARCTRQPRPRRSGVSRPYLCRARRAWSSS